MASITSIGDKNIEMFQDILPETPAGDECLRLGLIDEGLPVAAVELNSSDGICEINSIYVIPDKRRHQYGRACLLAAEKIAAHNNMSAIRAAYMKSTELSAFFSSCGYFIEEGDIVYELSKKDLIDSKHFKTLSGKKLKTKSIKCLQELSDKERGSLEQLLKSNGYDSFISKVPYCEQSVSKVHLSKTGEVDACLLADDQNSQLFITILLNATGSETTLMYLFREVGEALLSDRFDSLSFFAEDGRIPKLIENSIGNGHVLKESVITQNAIKRIG